MEAPKRDGIGAVLGFVSLLVGVGVYKESDDNDALGEALIAGGILVVAASYVSGGVGYFRVKRCRAAIRDHEQRMGGQAPAPTPPPVPP